MKPCRHLASLSMGKLTDRLAEGSAISANICASCPQGDDDKAAAAASEIFACLTCLETVCTSSSKREKGPNHLINHSHTRNHSIYFKFGSDATCIEEEFFCVLCDGSPKIREPGKKERVNLEKIKALFVDNSMLPSSHVSVSKDTTNSQAQTQTAQTHPAPRGLVNLGNTCFMNSALQLLAATLHRHGQVKTKTTLQLWNSLIYHLEEIYGGGSGSGSGLNKKNKIKPHSSVSAVNPKEFLNLLTGKQKKFASMQQQDAHDFLRLLFNSVAPETPQIELFGGEFVSKVTCDRCRNVSETVEPFLDISLSIASEQVDSMIHLSLSNLSLSDDTKAQPASSIAGLLRNWNKKILLHGENGYYCDNCSPKCSESLQSASLQFFLTPHKLPPFLILHLQRFKTSFNAVTGKKKSKGGSGFYSLEIEKDDQVIEFPLILTIPSECILGESVTNNNYNYKLYGYIIHEGSSTSSGHYTAVVHTDSGSNEGQWFYLSDTRVKEISKSRALDGETYSPYLLFYQRIS